MGVKQWLFQRASNLVFVLFGVWFFFALFTGSFTDYQNVAGLFTGLTSKVLLGLVLLLAGLNSILAGWQIAGDYAEKFGISQNLIVAFVAVVSIAYLVFGFGVLF